MVAGSAKSIDGDYGRLHPAVSDSPLEQPKQHRLLGKSVTSQHNQPDRTETNTSSSLTSSTSKGNVALISRDCVGSSSNQRGSNENNLKDMTSCREETVDDNVNDVNVVTGTADEGAIVGSAQDNSDSSSIISMASLATDTSSMKTSKAEDGDNSSLRTKKRRSFFNFRRSKKDKKEIL